jgi:hypothetical protein
MPKSNEEESASKQEDAADRRQSDVDEHKREGEEVLERPSTSTSIDAEPQSEQTNLFGLLSVNYAVGGAQLPAQSLQASQQSQASQPLQLPPESLHASNPLEAGPTGVRIAPQAMDVLMGRGRGHASHPGNRLYRKLIVQNAVSYNDTNSRRMKTYIVEDIVKKIYNVGVFRRFDAASGNWEEIDEGQARVKTAHAMRYLHQKIPSASSGPSLGLGPGPVPRPRASSIGSPKKQAASKPRSPARPKRPSQTTRKPPPPAVGTDSEPPAMGQPPLLSDQQILRGIGIAFDGNTYTRIPPEPVRPLTLQPTSMLPPTHTSRPSTGYASLPPAGASREGRSATDDSPSPSDDEVEAERVDNDELEAFASADISVMDLDWLFSLDDGKGDDDSVGSGSK